MNENKPVFIFTAPSTAGKNHILGLLKSTGIFDEMVTMTTRRPRSGERDGIDYHFVSHDSFEAIAEREGFIEFVKVPSKDSDLGFNYYGTPKSSIGEVFAKGKTPLVIIEPEGAVELYNYLAQSEYMPTCVYLNADMGVGLNRFAKRIVDDLSEVTDVDEKEKIANSYAQRIDAFEKELSWCKTTNFDVHVGPSINKEDEDSIIDRLLSSEQTAKASGHFPWEQAEGKKYLNSEYLVRSANQESIGRLSKLILAFDQSSLTNPGSLSKSLRNALESSKLLANEC